MVDRQLADNLFALQVVPTALQTSAIKAENVTNIGKTLALTTNKNIIMLETSQVLKIRIQPDPDLFAGGVPDFLLESVFWLRIRIAITNQTPPHFSSYRKNSNIYFFKHNRNRK